MGECQISALDGMVNLGSEGAAGGSFGLAFTGVAGLGAGFTALFTFVGGAAFLGARGGPLAVVPKGDGGAAVDPAVGPGDGPLLLAFGTLDAVRSSSIFHRAGPTRQPVPRVIISSLPGRL